MDNTIYTEYDNEALLASIYSINLDGSFAENVLNHVARNTLILFLLSETLTKEEIREISLSQFA